MSRARETTLTLFIMYLSPLTSEVYLLVNLFNLLVNLFFQSCMLPLFFSGLPSYLVGMKKRTSRRVVCKRNNAHFLHYVLISLDIRDLPFWLTFYQSCMLPLFFSRLLLYLVGIKRRTGKRVGCKRDNYHFLYYVLISPEVEILCRP